MTDDSTAVDTATIRSLVPHAGRMCLLDAVLDWSADTICARACSHRDPHHPLRAHDRLSALHLIEYGAQAMAVHGGLLARARGQTAPPGLLAGVRDVRLHVGRIDDIPDDLEVRATRLVAGDSGWLYAFAIEAGGHLLAEGRVAVIPAPPD